MKSVNGNFKENILGAAMNTKDNFVHTMSKVGQAASSITPRGLKDLKIGFGNNSHKRANTHTGSFNSDTGSLASLVSKEKEIPVYDSMNAMWKSPVSSLPVAKDIPRLCTRVEVVQPILRDVDTVDEKVLFKTSELDEIDTVSKDEKAFYIIKSLILVLTKSLEPEKYKVVDKQLLSIQKSCKASSDMQLVMGQVIDVIGKDSKVCRVLKCIHQNVVLHCAFELRKTVTKGKFTKDVRSANGWRIKIVLNKGSVQVTHTRREQSLDEFGDSSNHWEYEWDISMTFDKNMQEMCASQLRVASLYTCETIGPELKKDLEATIVPNMIVL